MASSLSAADGWSWMVRGIRTLNEHRRFWALWAVLQPVLWLALAALFGLGVALEDPDGGMGPHGMYLAMIVPLTVAYVLAGMAFHAVGWAKALDQLGYRPFRWADVRRLMGYMVLMMVVMGLVVGAVVIASTVFSGDMDHLMVVVIVAVIVGLPMLMVAGFLMVFLMPALIDTADGSAGLFRAIGASARLVVRHRLAVLIAVLLLFAVGMAIGIVAGILRMVHPIVGSLAQAVLELVATMVSILVLSSGYVQIRGLEALTPNVLATPAEPGEGPSTS